MELGYLFVHPRVTSLFILQQVFFYFIYGFKNVFMNLKNNVKYSL